MRTFFAPLAVLCCVTAASFPHGSCLAESDSSSPKQSIDSREAILLDASPTALFQQVRTWVSAALEMSITHEIQFEAVADLAEYAGVDLPTDGNERGIFIEGEKGWQIFVREGLPTPLLLEVIAHELAHAWQAGNCPGLQRIDLKEGFAQWVACQLLKELGFSKEYTALEARDDFYGESYRLVRDLEKGHGRDGLIKILKEID